MSKYRRIYAANFSAFSGSARAGILTPYERLIPSDLFIRFDPLASAQPRSRTAFNLKWLWMGAGTLAIHRPARRVFCGWVCPMGNHH